MNWWKAPKQLRTSISGNFKIRPNLKKIGFRLNKKRRPLFSMRIQIMKKLKKICKIKKASQVQTPSKKSFKTLRKSNRNPKRRSVYSINLFCNPKFYRTTEPTLKTLIRIFWKKKNLFLDEILNSERVFFKIQINSECQGIWT